MKIRSILSLAAIAAAVTITPNLIAQTGYNRTVARPAYTDVAGAWEWNDAATSGVPPSPPRLKA